MIRNTVRRVGVVGCGAIGSGIALEFALHGRDVTAFNRSAQSARHAVRRISRMAAQLVEFGLATSDEADRACRRIRQTTLLAEAVNGADYVAEAVTEDLPLKQRVFAEMDQIAAPDVILASTTTALSVTELAAGCGHPQRVLAAHYTLPAHLIPVVDIVPGDTTAPEAVEVTRRLLAEIGKTPVVFGRDTPGTIGPRLLTALIGEAFRLVDEGVADPVTIDKVVTGGIGRRFGATGVFDRADLAGLDTLAAVLRRQRRSVPHILAEKVAAGALGRKAGHGFYPWSPSDAEAFDRNEAKHLTGLLLRDRQPTTAPAATAIKIDDGALDEFLAAAQAEYAACTPSDPPRCFAILVGTITGELIHVRGAHFAGTVQEDDPSAFEVWQQAIIPCFGSAYANKRRGFWTDPRDLLRITRASDTEGLDVLGSIHLHPDWHRIGPPAERGLRISEQPTPMDRYLFAHTRWPLNMICHLEQTRSGARRTLAAWGPPPPETPAGPCPELPIRPTTHSLIHSV